MQLETSYAIWSNSHEFYHLGVSLGQQDSKDEPDDAMPKLSQRHACATMVLVKPEGKLNRHLSDTGDVRHI